MEIIKKSIKKQKVFYFCIILTIIVKAFLSVELAVILQKLIDSFNSITLEEVKKDIKYILVFILIFVLVQILYNYLSATIVRRVLTDVKGSTIESILNLSVGGLLYNNTSNYISLLTNHIEDIEKDLLNSWITLLDMLVMLLFSIIMLFIYSPIIGGVALAATIFSLIVPTILSSYGNILKLNYSKKQEELTKFTKDLLSGFNLIKEYKVEYNIKQKYNEKNKDVEFYRYKYNFTLGVIMGISMFLGYIIFFAVIIVGLILSLTANITIGTLIACVNLSNSLVNPVMNGLQQTFRIKAITGVAGKFDIKGNIVRNKELTVKRPVKKIELINVSYNYGNVRGVKNINLSFESGKKYLIVGTSGSGKSTLLKLLAGYFDDFDGDILIDDKDIKKIDEDSLSKAYSIVNQDSFLFDGTIEENIRFFQNIDEERINEAIEQAKLQDVISKQREEIKMEVGENGNRISGGEKQRISLARALARPNEVILLDEATSNLDNVLSSIIENNILQTKKMVILVSHRIDKEIASKYDMIIAFNEGEIVERGTFKELMQKKGMFYSLFYLRNINERNK